MKKEGPNYFPTKEKPEKLPKFGCFWHSTDIFVNRQTREVQIIGGTRKKACTAKQKSCELLEGEMVVWEPLTNSICGKIQAIAKHILQNWQLIFSFLLLAHSGKNFINLYTCVSRN
jgi:hypothetical protein